MKNSEDLELLFVFLRDALWHAETALPLKIGGREATTLLENAQKQAVSALIAESLLRNNVKIQKKQVYEAISLVEQVKMQSWRINMGVVSLHHLLTEYGVKYTIIKGQVLASYYPQPLLRQPGDIDYYCNKEHFQTALKSVKERWNAEVYSHESEKHYDFQYDNIIYECHFVLTNLYSSKRNNYLLKIIESDKRETIKIEDSNIITFSPTLHTLYVFLHLFYHLIELGVGLRQFCDLSILLHYRRNDINMDLLRQHLENLKMEKAYRACGCILVDKLGLSENELGYILNDDDRYYGNKILNIVLYRGNMGHHNKFAGFSGWNHKLESACIKFSHCAKFYSLAPDYCRSWLLYIIKTKVF